MTTKEFSVIMRATGGGQVQAELTRVGKAGEEAFARVGRASQKANTGLLNAGYQVEDVMVQWAAGTDPMRAVGQQLPQLLSGFGLLGVGLGAVTAALSVLLPKMFEMGDEAEEVRKRVNALTDAMHALREANSSVDQPLERLRVVYGDLAVAARDVLIIEQQMAEVRARRALDSASLAIGKSLGTAAQKPDAFSLQTPAVQVDWLMRLDEMAQALGLTLEDDLGAIERINDALLAVEQARGPREQAQAFAELREAVMAASEGGKALSEAGLEVAERLTEAELAALGLARVDMASNIGLAADEAGRLVGNLRLASTADLSFGRGANGMANATQRFGVFYGSNGAVFNVPKNPLKTGTSTGGGGGGMSDDMREARRIYESTRTDAEKFAEEQQRINDLFEKGYLDADTYARALDAISEKYLGASDAAKFFDGVTNDLKSSIIDLAMNGGASLDNLLKKLQEALYQGVLFDEGPLAQLFGGTGDGKGGLLGGILDWLTGGIAGKRAGGGSVHGGRTYLVGEKGPELFTPSNSGMITSNDRIGLGGGGATTVQVFDQRSGGEPVQTERRRGPSGEDLIIMTIRDATASGRMDGANKRFGLQPVKVRR